MKKLVLLLFYIIAVGAIQILNNITVPESLLPQFLSYVGEQGGNFFFQTEEDQFVKTSLDLVLVEGAFFNNATSNSQYDTSVSCSFFNDSVGVLLINQYYFSYSEYISSVVLFSPAKMHASQTAVAFNWNGTYLAKIWALPSSLDTTAFGLACTSTSNTAQESYLVQFDVFSGAVVNSVQVSCSVFSINYLEVMPDPSNPASPGIVLFLCGQQATALSIFDLSTWEGKQIPIGLAQGLATLTWDTIGLVSFSPATSAVGIIAYNLLTEEVVATTEISLVVEPLTLIFLTPFADLEGNMYLVSRHENSTQTMLGTGVSLVTYDEETQQLSFDGMIYKEKYYDNDNYNFVNGTFYVWGFVNDPYTTFNLIQYGK